MSVELRACHPVQSARPALREDRRIRGDARSGRWEQDFNRAPFRPYNKQCTGNTVPGRIVVPICGSNSVVECNLPKVEVAGSTPVSRSNLRE